MRKSKVHAAANQANTVDYNTFVLKLKDEIIKEYNGMNLNSYKAIWKRLFKTCVEDAHLVVGNNNGEDVWNFSVVEELKRKRSTNFSSGSEVACSSSKSSTSSRDYQKLLTPEHKKMIEARHEKLTEKWTLCSGRSVEDVIYEEGKMYIFDHPFHSYVISLDDDKLQDIVTADELEEMVTASGKDDLETPLPSHLKDVLNKLKMKSTFDEIESIFNNIRFSRRTHPEENWLVESILHYIELFYDSSSVRAFSSEATLFDEVYEFVKTSKKY